MNRLPIAMKQILQMTVWLLCLLASFGSALPARAGGWELVRYERQAQYDTTDIAIGYGSDSNSNEYFPVTELHSNNTTISWSGDEEVVTKNGKRMTGSGAAYASGNIVQLWWNNGHPIFKRPGKRGAQPAQSSGMLSITPVFRWKRARVGNYQDGYTDDPDDNPPDTLYYAETASIAGGEFIRQWDGNAVPYSAQNPFAGKHFTFTDVSHPFGAVGSIATQHSGNGYSVSRQYIGAEGDRRITEVAVGEGDEVRGETRTFSGTIEISTLYGQEESFDRHGAASLSFGYSAAPASFRLDVIAPSLESDSVHPTKKKLRAWASKHWAGTENPGDAIRLDWIGAASYTANASSDLMSSLGTPEYRWTLSDDLGNNAEDVATVHGKHFLNSGSKLSSGASSTAKLVIGGSNADSQILTATADIKWFQRPFTQYRAEVTTEVYDYNTGQYSELDSVMAGGNALTTEEERYLDEFTTDYDAMKTEVVDTGAQLVGSAFEAEMMVGSWFVPDEIDLATAGVTLAGKPLKELYKVGKTLRATAEVAARINRVRDKLAGAVPAVRKKLGHSNFAIVMKRKKYRVSREGHLGPNGQRVEAPMGELKEEEEVLCHIPGGACFVKGTLVSTKNGLRAIETLKAKDLVWSRDESSGKTELKPLTQTFERYSATLALTFSNGETIETTSEHPFYVADRGFVKAGELGIGTSIVTRAGPSLALRAATAGKAQTVYNFEVEDYHTYFVGEGEVWVHNADCVTKLADLPPVLRGKVDKAREHLDQLPPRVPPKTDGRAGGSSFDSGYGSPGSDKDELTRLARERAERNGVPFRPRSYDKGPDGITRPPGSYHASHTEPKLLEDMGRKGTPDEPIAVNHATCPDCQKHLRATASKEGRSIVVADPDYTRIFNPDNTVTVIDKNNNVVTWPSTAKGDGGFF